MVYYIYNHMKIKPKQSKWHKLHRRRAQVIGTADIYSEGGDASSEPGNVEMPFR